MLPLEGKHLFPDRRWQFGRPGEGARSGLQPRLAELTVKFDPTAEAGVSNPQFGTNGVLGEALLQVQADGLEPELRRITATRFLRRASPPRGAEVQAAMLFN